MTRFTHSILFFIAIGLSLLCSAVVMLFLNEIWQDAGFAPLVITSLILALLVPAAVAFASLRFIRWRQPVTAWLTFYLLTTTVTLLLGDRLLG